MRALALVVAVALAVGIGSAASASPKVFKGVRADHGRHRGSPQYGVYPSYGYCSPCWKPYYLAYPVYSYPYYGDRYYALRRPARVKNFRVPSGWP
jgi:hypothetical protein